MKNDTGRGVLCGDYRAAAAVAAAGVALTALLMLGPRAGAQAEKPAAKAEAADRQSYTFGDTVITAGVIDYDLEKRQYIFTQKVDLTSKNTRMTADKMTVQMLASNAIDWAKCEGNVTVDKKNPEDKTSLTARCRTLDYFEQQQKAHLLGGVVLNQTSPRLARPAIVTGERADLDLKARKHTVHRSPDAQARVHVEPKGNEGQATPPEPADLVGDRIDQDEVAQEYVATGNPFMVRPSSRLRGKTIRFNVDEKTNEISVAHAEENVVFDGQGDKGSVIHATGDRGQYKKLENEVTLTAAEGKGPNVHATIKDPDEEAPTVYQGTKFLYNTKTGNRTLFGPGARVIIPPQPKKQEAKASGGAAGAAPGDGKKAPPGGSDSRK